MPDVLVVVPTYNERENVEALARAVRQAEPRADLLFVDDASPDGTGAVLDSLAASQTGVHVLHRPGKLGLGTAYLDGFRWALERDYRYIFEMDADFSHPPEALARFLAAAEKAEVVLGSRYLGGIRVLNWPLSRLMLSLGAARYVRLITGMPFTDPTGGYKCFRREALERLDFGSIHSNGYAFQIEVTHALWYQGLRIQEIPIVFEERRSGHSKMSGHIVREALGTVWRLWFRVGLRRRPRSADPGTGGRS